MVDMKKLEADFKALCEANGIKFGNVAIRKYRIRSREEFYNIHQDLFDQLRDCEHDEDFEFDVDAMFKNDYPKMPDSFPITQELVDDLIDKSFISDSDVWVTGKGKLRKKFVDKTYAELPEEMRADIDEFWNELTCSDVEDSDYLKEGLDLEYFEESYGHSAFIESLAYYTVYREPYIENEDAAWRSDLIPFKHNDTFLLAFGGSGMDLSPRLDCYQALTTGSLPEDSTIFTQREFFDNVSPIKSAEIFKMCEMHYPEILCRASTVKEEEKALQEGEKPALSEGVN